MAANPARSRPRPALRRRARARRLSDPRHARQRPPARVPGQRRLRAAPAGRCCARSRTTRRTRTPTCTAAYTRSARRRRPPSRARASACGASSTRARRARSSSRAAPPRRSTWSPRPTRGRASSPGDEILISALEHHANIVPWQMVCEQTGCTLKVAPINRRGELEFEEFLKLLSAAHAPGGRRPRLQRARHRAAGASASSRPRTRTARVVLIDGAQAVPHTPVDVRALGADFYAFSGAQALRAHRHRRALRARGAARRRCRPGRGAGT